MLVKGGLVGASAGGASVRGALDWTALVWVTQELEELERVLGT